MTSGVALADPRLKMPTLAVAPPAAVLDAEVRAPGSKSYTYRAVLTGALRQGKASSDEWSQRVIRGHIEPLKAFCA